MSGEIKFRLGEDSRTILIESHRGELIPVATLGARLGTVQVQPSLSDGTGGGSASIAVRDEGVAQGAATVLDVVGAGGSVAVVAGVATLTLSGGGGAANLALGTGTATSQPVTNSNGTGFTLPVATGSVAGLESAADKAKLDGIASGATANSSDATLLARANHTGTQTATSTITMSTGKILGRSTASTGVVEELTVGSGLSLSAGTLTATGGGASPLTTKGDIYTRSSSADARLAVGADGATLVADSAQTSGLAWQAATAMASNTFVVGTGTTPAVKTKAETQTILNVDKGAINLHMVGTVANGTYYFEFNVPYAYTINSLTIGSGSGTCTVLAKIGSTTITGLSAVSVTSTAGTTNATAANVTAATNTVAIVVSSASSLTDLHASLNYTRN